MRTKSVKPLKLAFPESFTQEAAEGGTQRSSICVENIIKKRKKKKKKKKKKRKTTTTEVGHQVCLMHADDREKMQEEKLFPGKRPVGKPREACSGSYWDGANINRE